MSLIDHRPETVVLLGMGPSLGDYMRDGLTQEFQPTFTDEVWTINMASNIFFSDVIFWMDNLEDQYEFKPGLFEVMRAREKRGHPYKVITSKAYPNIVNSYAYPIHEIAKIAIPAFGKPYLNNGVAQAIAYAIWKKVKCLKLYGCDFTYPSRDYAESGRACVEAWCTLAAQYDMEVVPSLSTSLFDMVADHGVYGYKEQPTIEYMKDGRKITFSYKEKTGPMGYGVYVAEDTRNELRGSVSGEESGSSGDAGHDTAEQQRPVSVEAGAVAGSGPSLRDPHRHGRDQATDHADDVTSRAIRHVSDSGEASGVAGKGKRRPGRPAKTRPGNANGPDSAGVGSLPRGKAKAERRQAAKGAE